jgi:polysaccharide biosynthesis transport protein
MADSPFSQLRPPSMPNAAPAPAPPGSGVGQPAESEIHLLDRLAVIYRYRHISLAVFLLTSLFVMIEGYTNVKLYQAQARLLIEDERSTAVPGITSPDNTYYEDPEPYYKTQYRILKGRDLTRRVIAKVQLQNVPEFNGTAAAAPSVFTTLHRFEHRLTDYVHPSPPPAALEPPKPDETEDESGLVAAFLSRVDVVPVQGSRLVDVLFTAADPRFAALADNTLVDEYVAQNLDVKLQSSTNMLEWLDKELQNQQKKVEDSERALAEYRDRENAMSLDDKQNIVLARLTQLNDAVMKAKTARVQRESVYNQVKSAGAGTTLDAIPAIAQSPQIQVLKTRLTELQRDKARLTEKYFDKHPQVVAVNAALQDAQRQLDLETAKALQSVRNEYETSLLEERTLSSNLDAAKLETRDLNRKNIGYSVMEREAKSNRQVYDSLLQKEKELRVASNSRTNNVRVVDRADVPKGPISPGGRRTWLLAIAIGLVLSVSVAYGLDYMNDTIKTPEDIARRLKLPLLGLVPSVRGDKHPVLASAHVPQDFGESFRALRTALVSAYAGDGAKTLLVTSAQPLEGKTTTAANLAMALAYGGARVLLVDADMRRPGLHRPLRLTNERGLSQVLTGQARVRDVIQRTVDPNLLAITAGHTPPNPSELLQSERMKTLLTNLSHGPFDWIVIDAPPVLAVTDAVILAPLVSGVTFVVGAEMTRRRLAERALQTIIQSRPRQTAIVLNRVDFNRNKYYYSRYYGHQYKNYYSEAAV